jgi:predicted phage terminase large subunit-like protein
LRGSPREVERELLSTAQIDGRSVRISIPQDPGQAGKAQVQALVTLLQGFTVRSAPVTGNKVTRFGPFSAQAQAGNVVVLRGPWNDAWLTQLEGFPESPHDDDADATAEAFNLLTGQADGFSNFIGFMRNELAAQGIYLPADDVAPEIVRLRAPDGLSTVYLRSGQCLAIPADRIIECAKEDALPLFGSGFTKE